MGQNYSVEDSEECTAQDDKPLALFGKHLVADGKKVVFYMTSAALVN